MSKRITYSIDCSFCIDGFQPAGMHDTLGAKFRLCRKCTTKCAGCNNRAFFPETRCLHCVALDLVQIGVRPVLCPDCHGITGMRPLSETSEVTDERY